MRRIKKARITHLSLVKAGANRMPVLYKSEGQTVEIAPLTKFDDERGELTNVVYVPEQRDTDGDIADAAVIKDMAYDAAKRGLDINIEHEGKVLTKDQAFVAEQFLIAKGDERFTDWKDRAGEPVDLTGAWATVMKVDDPAIRTEIREGRLTGVSMQGPAALVHEVYKAEGDEPTWFARAMSKLGLGPSISKTEDLDMDRKELEEILNKRDEGLVEMLAKAMKPEAVKPEPKADPEIDFSDPKAVEVHLATLKTAELKKGVDFSDPAQVEAYLEQIKPVEKNEVIQKAETEVKIEELQAQIAGLKKAKVGSKQTTGIVESGDVFDDSLEKSEAESMALGRSIGQHYNKISGRAPTAGE